MTSLAGRVAGHRILFTLQAANGEQVDLLLDTGFQGELALDAATLGRLAFQGPMAVAPVELGDGSSTDLFVYQGRIHWLDGQIDVNALLIHSPEGAMGLGLLRDVQLLVNTRTGHAEIQAAP